MFLEIILMGQGDQSLKINVEITHYDTLFVITLDGCKNLCELYVTHFPGGLYISSTMYFVPDDTISTNKHSHSELSLEKDQSFLTLHD